MMEPEHTVEGFKPTCSRCIGLLRRNEVAGVATRQADLLVAHGLFHGSPG